MIEQELAAATGAAGAKAERLEDPRTVAPLGLVVRALEVLLEPAMDALVAAGSSRCVKQQVMLVSGCWCRAAHERT